MIQLKSLPLQPEKITLPLIIILLSCLAFIFDDSLHAIFIYQRDLVSQGEIWRIFTGHIFHTNGYHLLLNVLALIMLWALHGQFYNSRIYLLVLIISALTSSIGIHFFSLDIQRYVGLSGVLHGVFIWGAVMDIKTKDKTGYILLVGVFLKILHEQFYGASEDVAQLISASVAINAHLWGALGGVIIGIYSYCRK
ncbi:MAG: rhomboid family GlyGly-CTERM serine protease [Alteromonadaceae bacterium]|jgi:rhomboid family GlyGly-CTERM serine protease